MSPDDRNRLRHIVRLIHAYFDVDLDILWNTAAEALPPLRDAIAPALNDS